MSEAFAALVGRRQSGSAFFVDGGSWCLGFQFALVTASASCSGEDAHRDAVLAPAGYRVLRLDAALVVQVIDAAVARVRAALMR